jgi:hypothetical protein
LALPGGSNHRHSTLALAVSQIGLCVAGGTAGARGVGRNLETISRRNSPFTQRVISAAILPVGRNAMRKSFVVLTATALIAATPALAAKSKSSACTNDGLARADATVMQMPDGEGKTRAMQEMTAAKSSMTQQDMSGCATHMNAAIKMTIMKPKKS